MNPILLGLLCFAAGLLIGMVVLLFIIGASKTSKEHEIYMEGYNAGWFACVDRINTLDGFMEDMEDGRCEKM